MGSVSELFYLATTTAEAVEGRVLAGASAVAGEIGTIRSTVGSAASQLEARIEHLLLSTTHTLAPGTTTTFQFGLDNGDSFIFAGTSLGDAPTLQFLGIGGFGSTNTTGALVVKGTPGSPNAPAFGKITQAAHADVVDRGGFQITDGALTDTMAGRATLTIENTSTLANGGSLTVSSAGQGTVRIDGTINVGAGGTNVLNLNDVNVVGTGVVIQQGENDTTLVSSVKGVDFVVDGGTLTLANPTGFNGTIGPISAAAAAPAMGIFGEVDVLNAMDVAKGSFDTTTGMLSLLNSAGADLGDIHFAGDPSGLHLTQVPAFPGHSAHLAINDQGTSGDGAGGNIPLTFHP
jgi:hypothetical protein